jgi:hypothetical protein
MWAIARSVLKLVTKGDQGVIQRGLQQCQEKIVQHQQQFGLGQDHNSLYRRTGESIIDVV